MRNASGPVPGASQRGRSSLARNRCIANDGARHDSLDNCGSSLSQIFLREATAQVWIPTIRNAPRQCGCISLARGCERHGNDTSVPQRLTTSRHRPILSVALRGQHRGSADGLRVCRASEISLADEAVRRSTRPSAFAGLVLHFGHSHITNLARPCQFGMACPAPDQGRSSRHVGGNAVSRATFSARVHHSRSSSRVSAPCSRCG